MLFEDTSKDLRAKDRFRVDIHFSPGVKFRHAVFDEEDGISPTNSFANMPIKCSPDLSTFFVKRLPQIGHHPAVASSFISNGSRKTSLGVAKVSNHHDLIAEMEQNRRNSTSIIKNNHEPVNVIRKMPFSEPLLESCQSKTSSLSKPKHSDIIQPLPLKTANVGILKNITDDMTALIDAPQKHPPSTVQRPDFSFKPVELDVSKYSEMSVLDTEPEQNDKQVSFMVPPQEFPFRDSDATIRQNAFPSAHLFDEIQGAFETKSGYRKMSEASRSSENTICSQPLEDFVNTTETAFKLDTPNSAENVNKRFVSDLSSQSDSSIISKRQVSFNSVTENSSLFYDQSSEVSSQPSSAGAIHGSMEKLEVLETLEPLKKEPVVSNKEWYGERGECVCECV